MPDGFDAAHLPYGVAVLGGRPQVVTRFGDRVLAVAPLLDPRLRPLVEGPVLDPLLAAGPTAWAAVRAALQAHVRREGPVDGPAVGDVELRLPVTVGDVVDFYASLDHATNLGRILRPGGDPLPAAWRHLPVGYHGRSAAVVVSGTPVRRPSGLVAEDGSVVRRPTAQLDYELEVGFVVGTGNRPGVPVPVDAAADHVFGVVLVNDWSARDLQAFEYQPLGPFLGKSFATTAAAWVTPLAALEPYLVEPPAQEPRPDPALRAHRPWALDLDLEVALNGHVVARTGFRSTYWTFAQQLAHLTSNGAVTRPGDLFASGTVSGPRPGERGSLIERTWRGRDPLRLPDGTTRTWLEDGDEVVLRGSAGPVTLGEAAGRVTAPGFAP